MYFCCATWTSTSSTSDPYLDWWFELLDGTTRSRPRHGANVSWNSSNVPENPRRIVAVSTPLKESASHHRTSATKPIIDGFPSVGSYYSLGKLPYYSVPVKYWNLQSSPFRYTWRRGWCYFCNFFCRDRLCGKLFCRGRSTIRVLFARLINGQCDTVISNEKYYVPDNMICGQRRVKFGVALYLVWSHWFKWWASFFE